MCLYLPFALLGSWLSFGRWGRSPDANTERVQALYQEYGYVLRRRCYRILRDPSLVEDAMQEIFLTLSQQIEQYKGDPDKILAWLYRITTTQCLQLMDKDKRWQRRHEAYKTSLPPDESESAASSIEERLSLDAFLNDLPTRQREAVLYRYVSGMTQEEIARVMEVTRDQVRRWLKHYQTRGRIILRERTQLEE